MSGKARIITHGVRFSMCGFNVPPAHRSYGDGASVLRLRESNAASHVQIYSTKHVYIKGSKFSGKTRKISWVIS